MTRVFVRAAASIGVAIVLAPTLTAQAPTPAADQAVTAFVDVSVVPLDRERVLDRQTVVVRGERIVAMGPTARTQVPAGATRIDGRGKFLMPGLAEMHAHVIGGQNPNHEALNRDILFLYVANGITSIRAMLGAPNQIPLREQLRRNEILGPTMYVSAPSLNGNSAPTPDSGAALVRMHKAAGYDFLKIHPQNFRVDTYDAIVRTANEVGITWAGHVPPAVGLRHALASKQSGIDHLDGFLEAATPDSVFAKLQAQQPLILHINSVDPSRFPAIANDIKRAGSWQVPTMLVWENLNTQAMTPEQMAAWPEMKYIARQQLQNYITQKTNTLNNLRTNNVSPEASAKYLALRRQAMKALADAGAPLMMGTDSPQLFMVPGFALHRELGILIEAGLTPYQLYESGARNVARYVAEVLKQDGRFGTVAVGNRADLVLLEANPLQSVTNLTKRAGVMVRGRWVSSTEIETGLAELAAKYAQ
jgi:imidazolonepropionase-like amidohydrolase